MAKQFKILLENFLNRGNNAGFAIRDIVKLSKNYKNSAFYKSMHDNVKKLLDDFLADDKIIRVIDIKTSGTIVGNSINNSEARGGSVLIEIAKEFAPHRTDNSKTILVHPDMLEIVEGDIPNLPTIPDSFFRKADITMQELANDSIKDEKLINRTRKTEIDGKLQNSDSKLLNKNIKIKDFAKKKPSSNIVSTKAKIQESADNLMTDYINLLSE